MSNCLFGFNNRIDAATLSGGSWIAGLPLTNLQDPIIGLMAQSTNALVTSTKFAVDLGVTSKQARVVGFIGHNLSDDAKVRFRASETDPTMAVNVVYDSGWFDAWPQVYNPEDLDFEAENFWSGKWTTEQKMGLNFPIWRDAGYSVYGRYWLIEIDDTTNSDGYVRLGRPFLGEGWQPTINMEYGASINIEDLSAADEAISGTEFFDKRPKYRVARFTIANLTEDEAFTSSFDMMRRVGTTEEVFFVFNPEDTKHALRRSWLGRLRTLSPIEAVNVDANTTVYEHKEKL
jgi:hypothetical protein